MFLLLFMPDIHSSSFTYRVFCTVISFLASNSIILIFHWVSSNIPLHTRVSLHQPSNLIVSHRPPNAFPAQRLRLAHSCILARVLLHTGACANAALLTYLLFGYSIIVISLGILLFTMTRRIGGSEWCAE